MKAVITGGAGFIGSHVAEKLINEGYQVVVLDNLSTGRIENIDLLEIDDSKLTFLECDISVDGSWTNLFEGATCVIHLAALADIVPSIENPKEYFNSNVVGTFNVLSAANKHSVKKIIYSASSSCYGLPKQFPTKETSVNDPRYPYALTKLMGEDLVMHWSQVYGINAISLRFFNVYGKGQNLENLKQGMASIFLAQAVKDTHIFVTGSKNRFRDFVYINDVVKSVVLSIGRNKGQLFDTYNVCNSKKITVEKIIESIKLNLPYEVSTEYGQGTPGDQKGIVGDNSKILSDLGWKGTKSFEEGIKEMVLWALDRVTS